MAQASKATKLPEAQQTMTWEEFQAAFGDALTAPVGNPNFQEMRPVPDARKRGRKGRGDGEAEAFKPLDLGAPPPNRSVGGVRGKNETRDEMEFRMNQGIPRGSRRGGATQGLSQYYLMNQGGMGAEEARLKSNIVASRGGSIELDDKGRLVQRSATARRAPQSSTGRNYDPVAERKAMLANAKAAVDERKNLQASDEAIARKQFAASQVPDTMRGFANQYGSGQAKTLSAKDFANRPPATVTIGRNNPITIPMRDEIGFMEKDMQDEADFLKQKVKPKMNGGEVNPNISTMITGEDGPELQFKREDGSLFVIPADITAKITAGLEMENSEDGKESLRAIKGGKVRPKMNGGAFGGQQNLNQAWVKEYRNVLTAIRGGVPMPGIESNMSPYEANLTASRGGVPMPGMLRPGGVLKRTAF